MRKLSKSNFLLELLLLYILLAMQLRDVYVKQVAYQVIKF